MYRGLNGVELCRRLLDDTVSSGAEVMLCTEVIDVHRVSSGTFALGLGHGLSSGEDQRVCARAVVMAAGSSEGRPEFPGANLPGVMFSGDVQEMVNLHGRLPGRRALVVSSDNAGLLVAADLHSAGVEVVAVVDESPAVLGRKVNLRLVLDLHIPVLTSSTVVAAEGRGCVEGATVARVDHYGAVVQGTEASLRADVVCLAGQRTSESRLAAMVGCVLYGIEVLGGPVPVHDRCMATPVPGLYVCGDGAGVESGAVSLESGRLAGLAAARALGYSHPDAWAQGHLARGRLAFLRRGPRGSQRRQAKAVLAAQARRLEVF